MKFLPSQKVSMDSQINIPCVLNPEKRIPYSSPIDGKLLSPRSELESLSVGAYQQRPNKALHPTAYSLRSGRSSRRSGFRRRVSLVVRPHSGHTVPRGVVTQIQIFGGSFDVRRLIIYALAGLFIFYHTYTLYDLYLGSGTDMYDVGNVSTYDLYRHVQSILRVLIISSLLLVAMNWRLGLYGMWAAIFALVATHYWAYFLDLPFRFLEG